MEIYAKTKRIYDVTGFSKIIGPIICATHLSAIIGPIIWVASWYFFIHLKQELLTQFPASTDEKMFRFKKTSRKLNYFDKLIIRYRLFVSEKGGNKLLVNDMPKIMNFNSFKRCEH